MFHVIIFVLLGLCGSIHGICTEVTAVFGVVNSFDSHDAYGDEGYDHNTDVCWLILVADGYAVQAWTDDFHLERDFDLMNVYCGHDGDGGVIGEYSGSAGISPSFPQSTNGTEMYVEFISDYNIRRGGFRFNYTAITLAEADGGDCTDWDDWEDGSGHHGNHRNRQEKHHNHGLGAGSIGAIVFSVFLFLIILAGISACVVCFIASLKSRPKRLVGVQDYPLQMYPVSRSASTPVTASPAYPPMMAPPSYAAGGLYNNQVGDERKIHPDQMSSQENSTSPPPSYAPTATNGHD